MMASRMPQPQPIDSADLQRHIADLAAELYGDDRPATWAPGADAWNRWQERKARGLPRAMVVVMAQYSLAWEDVRGASEASEWRRMLADFGQVVPTRWSPRVARAASLDDPSLPSVAQGGMRQADGMPAIERWRELRQWCLRRHAWVVVGRVQMWELR